MMVPIEHVIALAAMLFAIGLVGVVTRRNLIVILMSIQVMLNASALAFVAWNRLWPQGSQGVGDGAADGHVFVLMIVTVAAAQIAVGLGILISMFRNRDSVNVDDVSLLRW